MTYHDIAARVAHLAVLAAVVAASASCKSDRSEPILDPAGPAVVEGPLTRTPIRFGTKNDAPELVFVDAELGHLQVPERHAEPDGRKLRVRYVRFPQTGSPDASESHPIVYLAGGPGGSGVWSAAGDRFPVFQRLREIADVIAYDQRGTWGAEPYLVCPGSWDYPLDRPPDAELLREAQRPFLEECFAHWSEQVDLSAYNTLESVGDLEALRRALGAEKLTLWGISYGTHLGLAYIRTHPERVHRAILAGVEGPDHSYKLPERMDTVLRRVAEAIRNDPEASRAIPDFLGAYRSLLEKLEQRPATLELRHPETEDRVRVVVGAEDLRMALYASLGEREDIEEIVQRALPVLEGDLEVLGELAIGRRTGNRQSAMALSMDCASGASAERLARIREQAPSSLLGNRSVGLQASCASWPVDDLGDGYRSSFDSNVPVLFLSGSLDVKTPPENAEEILAGFPNGRHVVIEGGSHDDDLIVITPAIADAMVTFLRGEDPRSTIELPPLRFRLP